mmetsp:Transcript_1098/g.3054  ORF Transcript_1098/g.3054 Transcript_1098/m.3054 type:complete len:416 (+) Transcript_1098:78-1325(+)
MSSAVKPLPDVAIVGTGEYVTGFTPQGAAKSDKSLGVVALTHFHLRKRGRIGERIALIGTNGEKFPSIREHFRQNLTFTDIGSIDFEGFPKEGRNALAYEEALSTFQPGDACIVFTPDDKHFDVCKAAMERGLHVMVTKPMVKTLAEHKELVRIAKEKGVLLQIEMHKRFDPVYDDARQRIQALGDFGHFVSYMSQPKLQLETFKEWAGISSDISYYLNAHHIDFHVWAMQGIAFPVSVHAFAATGVAEKLLNRPCEDTITLNVVWKNLSGTVGTAVYTSSWVASKADVHSQQRFFCLMERAEVTVDQAHRGYSIAEDGVGYGCLNPLYIRNKPDSQGRYKGQSSYGYVSFERFIDAVTSIRNGQADPSSFDDDLPTGEATLQVTAILEAGRRSLDEKRLINIRYDDANHVDCLE